LPARARFLDWKKERVAGVLYIPLSEKKTREEKDISNKVHLRADHLLTVV